MTFTAPPLSERFTAAKEARLSEATIVAETAEVTLMVVPNATNAAGSPPAGGLVHTVMPTVELRPVGAMSLV